MLLHVGSEKQYTDQTAVPDYVLQPSKPSLISSVKCLAGRILEKEQLSVGCPSSLVTSLLISERVLEASWEVSGMLSC